MIACTVALCALVVGARHADAQRAAFAAGDAELRAALCPARGACRLDPIVPAGRHGATSLAVVRVWSGPFLCYDGPGYRDYLVSSRAGVVRRERLLVVGRSPCLEWSLSRWSYRDGELRFTYGGMGPPPSADTDMRPITLHIRPWPLAIVASYRGDERHAETEPMLERGPIVVLTME